MENFHDIFRYLAAITKVKSTSHPRSNVFFVVVTQDNNKKFHQMFDQIAFLSKHLANTGVLVPPGFFDDDDGGDNQ